MPIELDPDLRRQAIASIERWFLEEREEKLGNIAAGALLNFVLEEIAPAVYNQAVAEAQQRLADRVNELDIELHEEPLQYWRRRDAAAPKKRR